MSAILLTGRHGDICNFLPVAKHIYDTTGQKPAWIVNRLYLSTLLGATYVEPDPVHFSLHKLQHALEYTEAKYGKANVLNATAWGKHWKGRRDSSFNLLSWENVGYGQHFENTKCFPLVFDNRDRQREAWLLDHYVKSSRKLILTCLGCSKSSPFHHAPMLTDILSRKWGASCEIVDLCGVKAARLYDLLGLFERAACLVTADTAVLHLATATPDLPVVALLNDNPFLATRPRCNTALTLHYTSALKRISEIHAAIFGALQQAQRKSPSKTAPESSSGQLHTALESA